MPLSKILESPVAVSVLDAVDIHLPQKKMFYGYCITFFHANRPITLAHGTSTHSYVIGFSSRFMGLNAY